LWGYLKSHVYTHKPRTLSDLKEAIREEVATIDREMLKRVYTDFQRRLENCIQESGHHLPDISFHSQYAIQMACNYKDFSVMKLLFR
jgi:hypothetical protein